ncbi:hypothetical protein [Pseudomonas asiatica]|uniref:Uncharacterized protein n=1 Tax=Pseudomonas asiatica TaxID=2219225 RepID=A0A9X4D219_9PSED|nr:hypothetical protein [Pseudomonas asiatica]MDD2108318.1 hypothetical protein [Pseudomonas asiatica]
MKSSPSVKFKKTRPRRKICSALFYAEHDVVESGSKTLIYSVYSTLQSLDAEMNPMDSNGVQRFAILWGGDDVDTRVFATVEKALVEGVMSPVLFVHYAEGALSVVFDGRIANVVDKSFLDIWQYLAITAIWGEWSFTALVPEQLSNRFLSGRDLREYGKVILNREELGIEKYAMKHYLFHKDWDCQAYRKAMGYDQEDDGLDEVADFDSEIF